MIKTRRSKIEPWIETLIQSYGQQEKTKGVKGYVLEVGDFSKSSQQEENAVAVLFISDGVVHIPVVLTKEAWEMMQEMEERDTVSNLENCTVFLQRYSLGFQREADMFRSKFFLTVNKLASVAFGAIIDKVPCCTSLPTVRQKICDTWRLLEGENSPTIMESQSEFCLTELLMEWEEDRVNTLLAEMQERLTSTPHPSSSTPQPSTSRAVPRPVWPSSMLPTGWHADRVRYRGQKSFTVPLSHLYISAEQNEQIQDHPGNSTAAGACDPVGHEDRRSLPNSGQDGNSLLGSAEQEEAPVNPWDIFAPAVENLSSSSLEVSRESVTPDLTLDSTLLLPQLEGELLSNEPVCVPMATSTQALPSERSSSRELFTSSDQSNSSALATGAARPEDTKAVEAHSLGLPGASTQTFTSSSTSSLIHPDGTPFSYCYQPTPCVAKAMSLVKIPDDFVQWSVRYLVRPGGSENTS